MHKVNKASRIYLFPTDAEATIFRELSPDARVVVSGVGMVATSATIMHLVREGVVDAQSCVVLAGIAGAYGSDVAVGEVVEVTAERCSELPERFQQSYATEPYTSLRCVRSNTVHGASSVADDALVENMEGAALFALAEVVGFRAVEIRAISNRVGEPFALWCVKEAVEALGRTLAALETQM